MDCSEEVSLLRRELSKVAGVYELQFDIFQARMRVEFDPGRTSLEAIQASVSGTGLKCEPWIGDDQPERARREVLVRRIMAAASLVFLAAGAAVQSVLHGGTVLELLAHQRHEHTPHAGVVSLFALSIAAGFAPFVKKAWASLRAARPDMNLLVAISICGACILGEWMEGASLAFLFALAVQIEGWSASRARQAVTGLFMAAPAEAAVLHDGHEHRMAASKVRAGDLVAVRPGERIPCDGEVRSGESYVDQSLITGESVPVPKTAGSAVYAGTLNSGGYLEVKAIRDASDTTVSRMLRMVTESTQRRTQAELFIERFVRWYTPAVFAIAFLVIGIPPLFMGGGWGHWFYQGMVVLLISCPCALVISTPVTMVSALAAAARKGVLVKGGGFLEETARLKSIIFDKTGVLTTGKPSVTQFTSFNGGDHREALSRLASLESRSEHPLGKAILEFAAEQGIEYETPTEFEAIPGRGVQATLNGETYWAGGLSMLELQGAELDGRAGLYEELARKGCTVVVLGRGKEAVALAGLSDEARPEALGALSGLRKTGIGHIAVLTGDSESAARTVMATLPIDKLQAGLLPDEKAAAVARYKSKYKSVAMVGDGYNDAQAMTQASVAISLGPHATDLAVETADVVLMAADLNRLPFLVRHAQRAARVIKQNISVALGLKLAFLAAAATGSATLWMAVMADMGATLLVTLNGLRLLRAKQ